MQDLDFLATVLGLKAPWRIVHADLDLAKGSIEAVAAYEGSGTCPTCGEPASIYDHRERRWRHLDLFQYAVYLTAQVPRINCDDGRIEIDNNAAERALRSVAVGRKNFLFAGSDAGGE